MVPATTTVAVIDRSAHTRVRVGTAKVCIIVTRDVFVIRFPIIVVGVRVDDDVCKSVAYREYDERE